MSTKKDRLSMGQFDDSGFQEKPKMCCGNSVQVDKGIRCLGIWAILQTFLVLMQGIGLILADKWWGFHLIFFNCVYIMQSWWYYKWFKQDTFENRRDLKRGYLLVLI